MYIMYVLYVAMKVEPKVKLDRTEISIIRSFGLIVEFLCKKDIKNIQLRKLKFELASVVCVPWHLETVMKWN